MNGMLLMLDWLICNNMPFILPPSSFILAFVCADQWETVTQ